MWGGTTEPGRGKTPCTYQGELVGRRAVLEQDVDDVGVPLLRSLVQRCVPVLQGQGKGQGRAAARAEHRLPPRNEQGRGGKNSPSFWH